MISTGNPSIGSVLYTIALEEFYKISFLTVHNITLKSLKGSVIEYTVLARIDNFL